MQPNKYFPLLFVALILGLVMRGYQLTDRFLYAHDNDLASWIVKDIVVDHHPRLIGQLTSEPGIFIGSLYYYLLIPFYLLFAMDPIGSLGFSLIVGLGGIVSIYLVMRRLYSPSAGAIAALLYSVSFGITQTEREVVPTTPVMLWSVWCYYAVNLVFQGKRSGLILAAVLFALVWHLNLALILLAPLIVIGIIYSRRKYKYSDFVLPAAIFILLSLPLTLFEVRHHFSQTVSLFSALTALGGASGSLINKIGHVVLYASRNANSLFWQRPEGVSVYFAPFILTCIFLILGFARRFPKYTYLIFISWLGLYVLFFTLHPINLSEYYLNGMNIVWLVVMSLFLSFLNGTNRIGRHLVSLFLLVYISFNLSFFLTSHINASGYLSKKALVAFIKKDSQAHGYPCVSISYITGPGYNLGYRYFFWLAKLHVNEPKSRSPVYSVVFPESIVDRLDNSFGSIGLIYPDYGRYTPGEVAVSCSGADANLTDPMFGFTK